MNAADRAAFGSRGRVFAFDVVFRDRPVAPLPLRLVEAAIGPSLDVDQLGIRCMSHDVCLSFVHIQVCQ